MSPARRTGRGIKLQAESPAVGWDEYPRIAAGEYHAYCKFGKLYFDPGFKRWTCLLRWDVLSDGLAHVLACIPQWFSIRGRDKPHASRRGKYFPAWVQANGGPPSRRDRLSPAVFVRRIARVEVGDTEGPAPYSVVRSIIDWDTGFSGNTVSKLHSQGEPFATGVESAFSRAGLSASLEEERRDGVKGKPKRFSLPAPSEAFALNVSGPDVHATVIESLPMSSGASALAEVEGESTPAYTQGAGAQETANPPKAHQDRSANIADFHRDSSVQ